MCSCLNGVLLLPTDNDVAPQLRSSVELSTMLEGALAAKEQQLHEYMDTLGSVAGPPSPPLPLPQN